VANFARKTPGKVEFDRFMTFPEVEFLTKFCREKVPFGGLEQAIFGHELACPRPFPSHFLAKVWQSCVLAPVNVVWMHRERHGPGLAPYYTRKMPQNGHFGPFLAHFGGPGPGPRKVRHNWTPFSSRFGRHLYWFLHVFRSVGLLNTFLHTLAPVWDHIGPFWIFENLTKK
jgi:hypothetical protein